MNRGRVVLIVLLVSAGFINSQARAETDEVAKLSAEAKTMGDNFTKEWQASCKKDAMTDKVSCTLEQFDSSILVYLNVHNIPSQICVFSHDFPGKRAAIRVDSNKAINTDTDGCAPAQPLFSQMKTGKIIKTQFVKWPEELPENASGTLQGLAAGLAEIPTRRTKPE